MQWITKRIGYSTVMTRGLMEICVTEVAELGYTMVEGGIYFGRAGVQTGVNVPCGDDSVTDGVSHTINRLWRYIGAM